MIGTLVLHLDPVHNDRPSIDRMGCGTSSPVHQPAATPAALSSSNAKRAQANSSDGAADWSSHLRGALGGPAAAQVAQQLLPFLPRRVATAHWLAQPGDSAKAIAQLHGALLLLDVSGFTRLSEMYGGRGTAGCEQFSLLVSDMFCRLTVSRPPRAGSPLADRTGAL